MATDSRKREYLKRGIKEYKIQISSLKVRISELRTENLKLKHKIKKLS